MEWYIILVIIINIILLLLSIYLCVMYCKCKHLHSYPLYNMTFLSIVIALGNLLRLMPFKKTGFRYFQAFLLVLFDKLLLSILTFQVIIINLGFTKKEFYKNNEKKIFFSFLFANLGINLAISSFYISFGKKDYYMYSYCEDKNNSPKILIDTIYNIVLLITNIYFIINLLLFFTKAKDSEINVSCYYYKTIIMLILNVTTFILVFLIIYDVFNFKAVDLIYLFDCLIIDLFYLINKGLIKESLKICGRNKKSPDLNASFVSSTDSDTNNENSDDTDNLLYY